MTGEIGISKKTRMWQRLFGCLMFSPFQTFTTMPPGITSCSRGLSSLILGGSEGS